MIKFPRCLALVRLFAAVTFSLGWQSVLLGQEAAPRGYTPPPTLEKGLMEDPSLSQAMMKAYASGDIAGFGALIEKQAADGQLLAEFFLGTMYIPQECAFLPFKNAPSDCPRDPPATNPLGLTPSFEEAIHWLKLASGQGSGEASEILAQVMERAIRSSASPEYQMTDVAHYHALARSQGYDLQDVEYSCYSLDDSLPADRLVMADTPAAFRFSPQELDALHAAGASGTLKWRSAGIQSGLTVLLRHPEGPKVHIRVILSHPVSREVAVPLPSRTDVVFLQITGRVITVPSSYPTTARVMALQPSTKEEPGGAVFQAVDGTFANKCMTPGESSNGRLRSSGATP